MSKPKGMTRAEVQQISTERLAQMREIGFQFVSLLGGNPGDDCAASMAKRGQKLKIEFATSLPLADCDKEYCKCVYLAEPS